MNYHVQFYVGTEHDALGAFFRNIHTWLDDSVQASDSISYRYWHNDKILGKICSMTDLFFIKCKKSNTTSWSVTYQN